MRAGCGLLVSISAAAKPCSIASFPARAGIGRFHRAPDTSGPEGYEYGRCRTHCVTGAHSHFAAAGRTRTPRSRHPHRQRERAFWHRPRYRCRARLRQHGRRACGRPPAAGGPVNADDQARSGKLGELGGQEPDDAQAGHHHHRTWSRSPSGCPEVFGCLGALGRFLAGTGRQFGADLDGEVQVRLAAWHLLQAFGDERGGL